MQPDYLEDKASGCKEGAVGFDNTALKMCDTALTI
jgi:hypothetical protein